jgi:2-phospho-L-lactate guanylyltransferase (CobY/MobA/RfbA family)
MTTVVVPFRGRGGKSRLAPLREAVRSEVALAMLGDVLAACTELGRTIVVTDDAAARLLAAEARAISLRDPGGGQGAAVAHGLARRDDLAALERATPQGGIAIAAAADGTTNVLGLDSPGLFAPLYGPSSALRFRRHAESLGAPVVAPLIPNLADDVDDVGDLAAREPRLGPRTRALLATIAA